MGPGVCISLICIISLRYLKRQCIHLSRMCDESKKSWFVHACEGSQKRCVFCSQSVCYYHGTGNHGGNKGGHSDCGVTCQTSGVYQHMCAGHMSKCKYCDYNFCDYHSKGVGNAFTDLHGGHVCSNSTGAGVANSAGVLVDKAIMYGVDQAKNKLSPF